MLYLGGTKIMINFIRNLKASLTDLFEGNTFESRSYLYTDENPKYMDQKMFIFPCKKSEYFGSEAFSAELHYAHSPENLSGEITWHIFVSFYDRKREEKICMIELNDKEIICLETNYDALRENGLYEFVNELIKTILDMSIGK